MTDENKIEATANAVKGLVEAVPVYQDVVQPAAREVGTALQTVAKTVHVLLAPVSALVWGYDQIKDFVGTRVAEKLAQVPTERLQSPDPSVAGPALESLRYTGHKEELREMYATLLATSMDCASEAQAHPSFVEMIRQLASDEARVLRYLAYSGNRPMLDLRDQDNNPPQGGHWVVEKFSLVPFEAGCAHPELGPAYMINLERLGLVELREQYRLNPRDGKDPYTALLEHQTIKAAVETIKLRPKHSEEYWYGAIQLTPLGRQFCTACIYERANG